jgi:glucose dehydrogenase
VAFTGDTYTIGRPTGWTTVSSEVTTGRYTESRWVLPSQPTTVAFLVNHSAAPSGLTPTSGGAPVRALYIGNPNYTELQWSLQNFPSGQGRVWQFIYSDEEEIDTFFVACGTGYGILGKAPADEFSHYQGLFAEATRSFEPTCDGG